MPTCPPRCSSLHRAPCLPDLGVCGRCLDLYSSDNDIGTDACGESTREDNHSLHCREEMDRGGGVAREEREGEKGFAKKSINETPKLTPRTRTEPTPFQSASTVRASATGHPMNRTYRMRDSLPPNPMPDCARKARPCSMGWVDWRRVPVAVLSLSGSDYYTRSTPCCPSRPLTQHPCGRFYIAGRGTFVFSM